MSDLIKPDNFQNPAPVSLIQPKTELYNQAKMILRGPGLDFIKPKFFTVNTQVMAEEGTVFEAGAGVDTYDKKSLFGTPIFDILTFDALSYVDENGKTVNLGRFSLNLALITVTKPRNIVKTKIAGKSGTIKEYMSDDDYHITINGMLTNQLAYSSPAQMIRDFDAITKVPQQLKVESNFLSYFGITDLVIEDSSITQIPGTRNGVDYSLTCCSDTPFAIELKEENNVNRYQSLAMF